MSVILNNGVRMPLFGLGTFLLHPPEVINITETALKQGYRLIDTAGGYHNESAIGEVLNKLEGSIPRNEVFITSKLGPAHQGTEKSKASALASLEALKLNYLDLYLIHWPGSSGMKPENSLHRELRMESWLQLEQLYKEGKFKAIGISNYTEQHIRDLLGYCSVKPAVLQVEVHPYLVQASLREFCKEHGIHMQAYSSLGSKKGSNELLTNQTVIDIAQVHQKTPAQVLLRWAIEHGMSVIPKTSNVERLKENMDLFDFCLTAEQMQRLNGLDKNKHYCWSPDGIQ